MRDHNKQEEAQTEVTYQTLKDKAELTKAVSILMHHRSS